MSYGVVVHISTHQSRNIFMNVVVFRSEKCLDIFTRKEKKKKASAVKKKEKKNCMKIRNILLFFFFFLQQNERKRSQTKPKVGSESNVHEMYQFQSL